MSIWSSVVGQDPAVAQMRAAVASPVHAYLLVGPAGVGNREALLAFAGALLCPEGGCGSCGNCRSALVGSHPDLALFERQGATLSVAQMKEAVRRSLASPGVAGRHVIALTDLHLIGTAAPVLLKAVEEPPATTVFLLAAEDVPPELETIASRCARIDLLPLGDAAVSAALVAEGVEASRAGEVARAAGGRLDRARLLAADEEFASRQELWRSTVRRLESGGTSPVELAKALAASIDEQISVLRATQERELAQAVEEATRRGEKLRGRADIEARYKREQRRVRTDELRGGLAVLARVYRDRLLDPDPPAGRVAAVVRAVGALDAAADALVRNPGERLFLEALLVRLGSGCTVD